MKMKFVYFFATMTLGMTAFAGTQNHYHTESSVGARGNDSYLCQGVRDSLERMGKDSNSLVNCKGRGEVGEPKNVLVDSACSCGDKTARDPGSPDPEYQCTAGVSWQCDWNQD